MAGVFEKGRFTVGTCDASSAASSPPKPLLIAYPVEEGEYSVVVLLHGFLLRNTYYSQVIEHVPSHGYIVVAPQLSCIKEIDDACAVLNWLSQGLQSFLPTNFKANTHAGHSRGGKTAFYIALGHGNTSVSFKLLIGIDPVAGLYGVQCPPPVLTYKPCSFQLGIPVLVIGTRLGEEKKNCLLPACAPIGLNHQEFYQEYQPPCLHLVARDYGHMDMLDDATESLQKLEYCLCVGGKNKELMRRFVGGLMVAFLQAYLDDKTENLNAILADPSIAPVKIDTPAEKAAA